MPLGIETKVDSLDKLAAVSGKPTEHYLFADEFNQIVQKSNELEASKADLVGGKVPLEQLPISGNNNRVLKFTEAGAIGNSQIFDNGTSVGINTNTPSAGNTFEVNGRTFISAGTDGITIAPLVVRNTIPYQNPFTQQVQIWQAGINGNVIASLNALGSFTVASNVNAVALRLSGVGTNTTSENMIARSGQPQTGISIISGHQITFASNATERMRLDSNGNFVIGATTAGAILDVRAQGALSTDIAFRVRNSVDTANLFQVNGDGSFRFNNNGIVAGAFTVNSTFTAASPYNIIGGSGSSSGKTLLVAGTNGLGVSGASTNNYFSGFLKVGDGTAVNSSAVLEAVSTTRGFLPPRMTNAQRLAIASPAVGLIVYCTDATEGLYINKSTGWTFII